MNVTLNIITLEKVNAILNYIWDTLSIYKITVIFLFTILKNILQIIYLFVIYFVLLYIETRKLNVGTHSYLT